MIAANFVLTLTLGLMVLILGSALSKLKRNLIDAKLMLLDRVRACLDIAKGNNEVDKAINLKLKDTERLVQALIAENRATKEKLTNHSSRLATLERQAASGRTT